MYIVAFYSYRGGVGRTTTLINVGMELVRRGRKVLLVDFDLESPDLTSFPPLARAKGHAGVVEFISAYREKGCTPDVVKEAYLCDLGLAGTKGGRVWVMPAGKSDASEYWREYRKASWGQGDWDPTGKAGPEYWKALAEIDWEALYEREQGYLFFEETREQWRNPELGLDYVLIDTHAGITPSLGITTRQLADAVVMMVNPQQRGQDGLDEVSSWIETEAARTSRKPIEQIFVAAKVVEADEDMGEDYENEAGIFDYAAVIPFSQRLLLGERIVEQEKREEWDWGERRWLSRDRLAKEYRKLTNAIIMANFAGDPDGARVVLYDIHNNPWKAI